MALQGQQRHEMDGRTFLGVIEFFSDEIREPDAALLEMLATIGRQPDGPVHRAPASGDDSGRLFGMERALEVVRAHRRRLAGEIIAALIQAVRDWSNNIQADDMTAIVIKVAG